MQKELNQLEKMLERKKEFLARVDNEKTKSILKVEINVIENFIQAATETLLEYHFENQQYTTRVEQKIKQLEDKCFLLEGVCLIHGINDIHYWLHAGSNFVLQQLRWDRSQDMIRIPNQLRLEFYGK